ncbi:MAG: glycosyltransferase family 2 protein [Candidatus Riflebacteria bacterium]|nr:glycosyltransferase family 2 protein [Candidatus Riflebacteria bacterium]
MSGSQSEPPGASIGSPSAGLAGARRCSLIITNYNGIENLRTYLPLNLMATVASSLCDEVVVVDDGSDDGSVEYIWRVFPKVRVLPLPANRGFGNAANAGFRAARNDWVVNISNDMVVTGRLFEHLFENMVSDDVFHVSARLVGPDGTLQRGRALPFFAGDFKIWKRFSREPPVTWGPRRRLFHHFCGAIGLFNRRIFLDLGGFDDLFLPFFVEETDLCYRAWKRGYRVLYDPRAWVIHHHRESGTILHKFAWSVQKVQYRRNRLLFLWKHLTHPGFLLVHGIYLLFQLGFAWLGGHTVFYRGFWRALGRWRETMARRQLEAPRFIRSDRQVFSLFALEPELPTAKGGAGDEEQARAQGRAVD